MTQADIHLITNTPDIDNLMKLVLDRFNKILYPDNKSMAELHASKIYWTPHDYYTENQDQKGYTAFKLVQIKAGTTAPNCPCILCKKSRGENITV